MNSVQRFTLLSWRRLLFAFSLLLPNIWLSYTDQMPLIGRVIGIVAPLLIYYGYLLLWRNEGKGYCTLIPLGLLSAFQLILLQLYGRSIIAVDMWLNIFTSNPAEAGELLGKMTWGVVGILAIYLPLIVWALVLAWRGNKLSRVMPESRLGGICLMMVGLLAVVGGIITTPSYSPRHHLFPIDALYNLKLSVRRAYLQRNYLSTLPQDFTYSVTATHSASIPELYIVVVGETARMNQWQLYGYPRPTSPRLQSRIDRGDALIVYTRALSQANTTYKSVPMLLSTLDAHNYNDIYTHRGIITAFREGGFYTYFLSNQQYNHSFIDYWGHEADVCYFLKEQQQRPEAYDQELLPLVEQAIAAGHPKTLIVLHCYGSHFNPQYRYPDSLAYFVPDRPIITKARYRERLVNAYDNTIRYTDQLLDSLLSMLEARPDLCSALLYTSDHGEDLFDDDRRYFLHSSPIPSYYQLHVPLFVWLSSHYRRLYPTCQSILESHRQLPLSPSTVLSHTLLDLSGLMSPLRHDSLSVASSQFRVSPLYYLNDHNEACPLSETGLESEDYRQLDSLGIPY